ncbi:methyltransferase domain-containing protein [Pseudonocardia sp. TRM90224]|uniref:spermine/spermidine synthase domain-containing protein n=1 Tax=Pseudonocardia sp. TRM90224 TaxID=2812678 RepID=UPI001E3711B6|nr:methyltransferase domain-containing protein [Pseudonocardia sp. TRM90224]
MLPSTAASGNTVLGLRAKLVVASALMLFVELALIRWAGSNVVHLSYFSNFVLLGSFLGIGLGFLRAGRAWHRPFYSPITLAALVLFVEAFPVTVDRGHDPTVIYFTSLSTTGPPTWVVLPIVFVAAAVVTAGPAELTGQCFAQLPRLTAYRFDLVGSLIGIVSFTALSFIGAPPVWWGVIVTLAFAVLLVPAPERIAVLVGVLLIGVPSALMVSALQLESTAEGVTWSPYYKIKTTPWDWQGTPIVDISANGVPHQQAIPAEARVRFEPQYGLPYQRTPGNELRNVLIVGAGSGTDVAIALRNGAQHVDAVEIDPELLAIGRERHPDRPYADPRVDVHVDDGRAFLSRTDTKYDLILFALPDSLTLVQGASSLRLESYLFTEQAFASAREHLAPGGAFSMYNYYRETWLIERLANTASTVFGHRPCVDVVGGALGQAVITSGLAPADQTCASTWAGPAPGTPDPATDQRPFLYLYGATIPSLYLVTIGLILLVSVVAVGVVGGGSYRRMRPYADLFLLGAGFLLLQTKSIAGFALLFGTTWVVNAIVFAGVLLAVLAAVEVTRRFRTPPLKTMYVVLFAGLLLSWLVPDAWLLAMPVPLRALTAVVLAFLPVFAANVVFAKRFTDTEDGTAAFGANLLGAMVGGCLEYLALLVGFPGLLIVAALLYAGAFALAPKGSFAPR